MKITFHDSASLAQDAGEKFAQSSQEIEMKYVVEFWYGTDLRMFEEVEALNEFGALVKAFEAQKVSSWLSPTEPNFYIRIMHKTPIVLRSNRVD